MVQPYTRTVTVEQDGKAFRAQGPLYRYLLPDRLDVGQHEVTRKLGIYQAQILSNSAPSPGDCLPG